tara:strand:+ start:41 stop:586 length:546 start_codon:yes stop_codon:yes gene_type:complete
MPGTKMPKMGHEPKMGHKPKMTVDISKVAKGQQRMIKSIVDKAMMFKTPKQVEEVRPMMAHPKMNDDKNFTKMSQEMAAMLVPKMDHAKMYKPTKYHDGPMMYGKPKMTNEDKKKKKSRFTAAYEKEENMVDNPFFGSTSYQGLTLDKGARTSKKIPQIVRDNIYKRARKKAEGIVGIYDR